MAHLGAPIGRADARLAAEAYAAGIAEVERLRRGISCDFALVDGYLAGAREQNQTLAEELAAAHAAGITEAAWLSASPFPGEPSALAVRFPGQARVHPLKYLEGLLERFLRQGGAIRRARVQSVHGGAPGRVFTADGPAVTARAGVVLANNAQMTFSAAPPQTLYTSYTIAARIAKGSAVDAVMWDLADPYHYIRLHPESEDSDLILIGGADHPAADPADPAPRFEALEAWARRHFPEMGAVTACWSGNIKQTSDNLAYCGRWPWAPNVFVMDGDGGLGFNHATIGAMILRDMFKDTAPAWARLFDPARYDAGNHPLLSG